MNDNLYERLNNLDARIVEHSEQVKPDEFDLTADKIIRRTHGYIMDVLEALDVAESHYRQETMKDLPYPGRFFEIEERFFGRLSEVIAIRNEYNGNIE